MYTGHFYALDNILEAGDTSENQPDTIPAFAVFADWQGEQKTSKQGISGDCLLEGADCCGPYIKWGGGLIRKLGNGWAATVSVAGKVPTLKTGWHWEWGGFTPLRDRTWGVNSNAEVLTGGGVCGAYLECWRNCKRLGSGVRRENMKGDVLRGRAAEGQRRVPRVGCSTCWRGADGCLFGVLGYSGIVHCVL